MRSKKLEGSGYEIGRSFGSLSMRNQPRPQGPPREKLPTTRRALRTRLHAQWSSSFLSSMRSKKVETRVRLLSRLLIAPRTSSCKPLGCKVLIPIKVKHLGQVCAFFSLSLRPSSSVSSH